MASLMDSDISKGIGRLMHDRRIAVPYYQRSYAWKKSQVNELCEDFRKAIDGSREYYFLGSIVGCESKKNAPVVEIVDGQQRLATTAILLAAIRDRLVKLNEEKLAGNFESHYLVEQVGFVNPENMPRIRLNEEDNDYFQSRIVSRVPPTQKRQELRIQSHRWIDDAAKCVAAFLKDVIGSRKGPEEKAVLEKWVSFIDSKARIIFIVVDDPGDAYMIFETLNDRGLDLTVADLTKNYLFMTAGESKIDDMKSYWSRMTAVLSTTSESEATKVYIHHLWSSINGVTRDKELFKDLRKQYDNSPKALEFMKLLCDQAGVYAALANSESDVWNKYGRNTKLHVGIINSSLKATQVRMLLLAVLDKFTQTDVETIVACCLWWSVRFLVAGGSPSEWEAHYANRAKAIREDRIKNASQLIDDMSKDVPSDQVFKTAFAEVSLGKAISRYLLRCMEDALAMVQFPALAQDNPKTGDLEHIMPQNPDPDDPLAWQHMDPKDHERLFERLGNCTLMLPEHNKLRGNGSFPAAQPVYALSGFELTKALASHQGNWDEAAIQARQEKMAAMAVDIWPGRPPVVKKKGKKP